MTVWHRAVAVFLLMMFTPAAVLAGTPLRYCLGDEGYRSLAYVLNADHDADEEGGIFVSPGDTVWMGDGARCSDRQLLGGYQSARVERRDLKLALSNISPILPPIASALDKTTAVNQLADGPVAFPLSTDPRILARKTTVLLV